MATLSVTPPSIDFGNVAITAGASTINETIDSTEMAGEEIDAITITGTGCSVVTITHAGLPATATSMDPFEIAIHFDPVNRVAVSCTVTVVNDGNPVATFMVTGDGTGPEIAVPAMVSFADTRVSNGTTTQNVLVANNGEQNLTITAFSSTLPDYTTSATFPIVVAAGGDTVNIPVTFNPSQSGVRMATLTLASNDPITPNASFTATGTGTNAAIAVTDVNFMDVTDNTTSTQDITITNTGASPVGPLRVTSASISGGSWFKFADNGASCGGQTSCSFSNLDVTTTATVAVRCTPVSTDPMVMQTAVVTFVHDGDGGDDIAMLTCIAGRPNAVVSTMTLAFGDQLVNTSSSPQMVTVQNTGNRTLTYDVTKSGMFAARYTLGGCHTTCSVAPSSMQTFTVTFNPNQPVQMDITLTVSSNDPDTAMSTINVTGRGIAPAIAGPMNVALGDVEVGKQSGAMPLTITNNGSSTLNISAAVVDAGTGDYTATGGSTTVGVGLSTTWNIVCAPQGQGSRPGNFRIDSDAFNAPVLNVPLSCNGTRGFLEVSPATLPFGNVQQDTIVSMDVLLENSGNLDVANIAAVSSNAAYTVVASSLPSMLLAGGQQMVTIRFAPTATNNGGPGTITFSGNWGTTPTATMAVLNVSGAGLTAGLTLSQTTIDFGNFRFDTTPTRTFCITNTGQSAVTINSPITFTPTGATASNEVAVTTITKPATCGGTGGTVTLPQSLAPNELLEITVRMQPANRIGPVTGSLRITSSLPTNPDRTVTIMGNSITGMLTMVPGMTVNFGDVDIQGGAPVVITIRLRNTGTANLDLSNFTRTANAAFTMTLPSNASVPPAGEITFNVTYAPTVASATPETVTITHAIAGDINVPATNMIVLQGRGIDRDLELVTPLPTFPETFRNPGTDGPVRTFGVRNRGTAPLNVSAVMVSQTPEVWKVLDAGPMTIPPGTTADVRVRFEPTAPGPSSADLQIVNDDDDDGPPITNKVTVVPLVGNCVNRKVAFNPMSINVGYVEVGQKVTLPDALIVTSMDDMNAYTIQTIAIEGGNGMFTIDDPVDGVMLDRVLAERRFDVSFTPTAAGPIAARAKLFLDMDPEAQAEVELVGTAVFVDARGGGGCSTGSGAGFGAIVLVLALLLRRRAVLVLLLATPAQAEDNIELSIFDPAPATISDGFQLQSPVVGAHGSFAISAVFSYARDPLLHLASSGGDHGVVTGSSMLELGGAVALLGRFELGASMPFYSQSGDAFGDPNMEYTTAPADGTATGDLRVHGKVGLIKKQLEGEGLFGLGASIGVTVPTATDGQLTGTDDPSARVLGLASLTPGAFDKRVTVSANLGAIIRAPSAYHNIEQKSGVLWGLGTAVRVADPLWIAGEMFGEFVPSGRNKMDGSQAVLSPIEWLAGLRWRPDHRFTLSLAAGRGLTSAAGAPALRGVLALSFTPGADTIKPIHEPLPPKPDVDTDGDGLVDSKDKCADEPEDADLYDDTDGCPDLDNDGDGIADAKDKCALEAEDKDKFEDEDGCLDKDNDGDTLADSLDKCPLQAEDKDSFQDADGCPEPDNDKDGLLDAADKCPLEKEVINGTDDNDGCPDRGIALVIPTLDRFDLMEQVQFDGPKIKKSSHNVLGQIAATLRAHPEILRVRIGVHVSAGRSEAQDQQLSEKRAAAIRQWLVEWGISEKRLEVRGWGSSKPLGGSASADERIEIVIKEK